MHIVIDTCTVRYEIHIFTCLIICVFAVLICTKLILTTIKYFKASSLTKKYRLFSFLFASP